MLCVFCIAHKVFISKNRSTIRHICTRISHISADTNCHCQHDVAITVESFSKRKWPVKNNAKHTKNIRLEIFVLTYLLTY